MIKVAENAEVKAQAEELVALINEPDKLPDWLPGVTGAQILAREGDISVVELSGPRLRGGRLVLECVRTSAEELIFAEVDRWRGRGLSGSIRVHPHDGGGRCLVRVVAQRHGSMFNLVARRTLRRTVNDLISQLVKRAEHSRQGGLQITSGRRKILEIVRRDGRLYVCIEGSSVELPMDSGTP